MRSARAGVGHASPYPPRYKIGTNVGFLRSFNCMFDLCADFDDGRSFIASAQYRL
jgi:hypothetical protein